ncbi:MAG: hypothetical protein P4L83_03050 [Nevskia sp.]|nr:hypothetical protein [Nevskia sp.]
MTTLEADGWQIDDAEVAHAEHPDTYWIPSLEARQSLQTGSCAKIRFYIRVEDEHGTVEDCGERMWVEVLGKLGKWYRGQLSNQPASTLDMRPGLEVWFQARHVIDIEKRQESLER